MFLIFSSCFPTGATEKHELLKVDSRNATCMILWTNQQSLDKSSDFLAVLDELDPNPYFPQQNCLCT